MCSTSAVIDNPLGVAANVPREPARGIRSIPERVNMTPVIFRRRTRIAFGKKKTSKATSHLRAFVELQQMLRVV